MGGAARHSSQRAARQSARSAASVVGRSLARKRGDSTPRSSWSACSAVSTGGATVSNGCRHSRASARSRLQSSPEKIATTLAWPKPRPCRTDELDALLRFFREGGPGNLRTLLRRLAHHAGSHLDVPEPRALPRMAGYIPGEGAVDLDRLVGVCRRDRPRVPILFYRAMLLAADTAPIDALCRALTARGLAPAPLVVTEPERCGLGAVRARCARAARAGPHRDHDGVRRGRHGGSTDAARRRRRAGPAGRIATTKRAAWTRARAGSAPPTSPCMSSCPSLTAACCRRDRLQGPLPLDEVSASARSQVCRSPTASRCVADRVAALVRLQSTPRAARRMAVLLPDYPGASGRTGYAVGLDVPASVVALLADLDVAGYDLGSAADTRTHAARRNSTPRPMMPRSRSRATAIWLAALPADTVQRMHDAWGASGGRPPTCGTARSGSARVHSATCSWRFRPTEDVRAIAGRLPRSRSCRRATRCSRSGCGFATSPRPMRSFTWAPMARSNGCPARRWR